MTTVFTSPKRILVNAAAACVAMFLGGWGPLGHAIVARIAARELTPAARTLVEQFLGGPTADRMAAISSWADWQGRARPETKPWHYVDIEIDSTGYDEVRDCPNGNCIVAAIGREETILRDAKAPRADRADALAWLIHLAGDLHQPLHCADRHDRGGNEVKLVIDGRRTNLHALWDEAPAHLFGNGEDAADLLERAINPTARTAWRAGSAADWANESFRIARDRIYRADHTVMPDRKIVSVQLEKAGTRLALILNDIFK